jgi:hypothetical protein
MLNSVLKKTSAIVVLSAMYATSMAQSITAGDPQIAVGSGQGEVQELVPGAPGNRGTSSE